MFKNLFGLKKQPDEIKIAEEESQMTQDFEQASLEDFKILENEEAMEALTMPEYDQHSEDLHIDTASGHAIEDVIEDEDEYAYYSEVPEVIAETPIYPIHNGIPPEYSDEYLFTAPQINGWNSTLEQELIFSRLICLYKPTQSILDVGCGRADLYGYLRTIYPDNEINYIGIDSNSNILQIAERKYPILQKRLINSDILAYDPEFINYEHDWVFASGIFNLQEHSDQIEYTKLTIDNMMNHANVGVAFNLLTADLSPLPELERSRWIQHDPGFWLNYLIEKYTKVTSRSDYMKGDITFIILK